METVNGGFYSSALHIRPISLTQFLYMLQLLKNYTTRRFRLAASAHKLSHHYD